MNGINCSVVKEHYGTYCYDESEQFHYNFGVMT